MRTTSWNSSVGSALLGVVSLLLVRSAHALPARPGLDAGSVAAASPAAKEPLDRETPRRTVQGFLREARDGNFRVSADYLDLRAIPAAARNAEAPDLAQKLAYILQRQPTLDLSAVPDVPEGDPKTPGLVVADTLYADEEPVPIELKREHFPDSVDRWLIDQKTVELIPALDRAYGPRPLSADLPASLTRPTLLGNELWQWIGLVLALPLSYGLGRLLAALLLRMAASFARKTPTKVDDALVESARHPARMILGALALRGLLGPLQLTTAVDDVCGHASYTLLVVGIAWLLLRALGVWMLLLDEQTTNQGDAFADRRIRTQAVLLRRVASVIVGFVAASVILLQFDFVRGVGVSLLASAGVLGVVLGFAAQKSLGAIVGGIQFSIAQPVRIGDQIVVEGNFGEVETINLTNVVLRVWDKRRLILPITYFLEKPFENWTHTTTDLIGVVLLKVGFTLPLDHLRAELKRICEADPNWDKVTCSLQATDSDANTVTVRAVASAENASKLWNLRCTIREHLLAFIHTHDEGKHLPQMRHVLVGGAAPAVPGLGAGPGGPTRDRRSS